MTPWKDADFVPVDEAAKNGERHLVRRESHFAAAQWTGDFWSFPYGDRRDECDRAHQIDFEPTHYLPKAKNRPAKEVRA